MELQTSPGHPLSAGVFIRACLLMALPAMQQAAGQSSRPDPLGYSVATPRPISPAQGTTNPSAQATQRQNPYLGSVPANEPEGQLDLSLDAAIARGLRYNLGLVESGQASADVRAERLRALSALLPQISARGTQALAAVSLREIGLKLPPIPGVAGLPPTTGAFSYQDARVGVEWNVYSAQLRERYKAQKIAEQASVLSVKDSRDVVVFAVATAYLQVVASAARVDSLQAVLASSAELERQTADRVAHEVLPEIESLRAQVELQSAAQRLTNANNQLEKDRLTLARIIGLGVDRKFTLTETLSAHSLNGFTQETATVEALRSRSDLTSAEAGVHAAEATLRAEKGERLPTVAFSATYGAGGTTLSNSSQVYGVSGSVSVPLYTGGRIQANIEQARDDLARRQAEYNDIKGRIAYDVRVAWLDLSASESAIRVADRNTDLAGRALAQAEDRYANGVTNLLEVVQAREAVAAARDNRIDSLYSFNVALVSLSRALGNTENTLHQFRGGK